MLPDLENNPGLIPVALDERARKVRWMDVGRFHFYQGFFSEGLEVLSALSRREPEIHLSDLDELPGAGLCRNGMAPSVFLFHAGRCGSTLLSRLLARSREHLVFSEAQPHNQIWNLLPPDRDASLRLYRGLVLAMGRHRLPSYRAHIVKFTSFNILKARFIREAFPGVPALFLFRRPDSILASYHRGRPRWLGSEHELVKGLDTPEAALEAFLRAALSFDAEKLEEEDFRFLDYDSLTPECLPGILRYLRLSPPESDLASMLNEFTWNAKSGVTPAPFQPPRSAAPIPVPPAVEDLYRQLTERAFDPLSQRS